MPKRCVVQFCSNTSKENSLHGFPKDAGLRRQWVKFVQTKRADFKAPTENSQSVICGAHFKPECFSGSLMAEMGFKSKRDLVKGSVPTIHILPTVESAKIQEQTVKRPYEVSSSATAIVGLPHQSPPLKIQRKSKVLHKRQLAEILEEADARARAELEAASYAQADIEAQSITEVTAQTNAVSCQTNPVPVVNQGTQLSALKPHVRSKGVNTAIKIMIDAGMQTEPVFITSVPPCSTPKKCRQIPDDAACLVSPIKPESPKTKDSDPDYHPTDISIKEAEDETKEEREEIPTTEPAADNIAEKKYIVFESKLLQLFDTCPHCAQPSQGHIVDKPNSGFGTMVRVEQRCMDCEFTRKWDSQPMLKQMPLGNLMLSASILFSGSQISQVLRMLHIFNVAAYSRQTFQRHQNEYVIPTIINGWKEKQADLITELKESQFGGLKLAGDCRNDSPGHSAKYGTYTLIEQTSRKVVDLQQVQSNEAGSSNACELVGFKRSMSFLTETEQLSISSLVTDRHRSIAAFIRDDLKVNNPMCANLEHFNDVWHTAKGLGKKIIKIGAKHPEVNLWKKSVVNHMYFVAATAPQENRRDNLKERWLSIENHLHDVHEHDLDLYPMCDHGHLLYDRNKEWLVRGTVGSVMLTDLLTSTAVVKDVQNLTPEFQTSSLEAFHSLVVRFAPKHTHFGWLGQMARTYLAAMHHNENANRMQAITRNGVPQYRVSFPKYKAGQHTVRATKTEPTHDYARWLMYKLLNSYNASPAALRNSIQEIRAEQPAHLAAAFLHPDKDEAVAQHTTRFARGDQQ